MRHYSVVLPTGNAEYCKGVVEQIRDIGDDCRIVAVADFEESINLNYKVDVTLLDEGPSEVLIRAPKPFCFGRNINLGVAKIPPSYDIILTEDDARILTPRGLSAMRDAVEAQPEYGVVSAAILNGPVCNEAQRWQNEPGIRDAGDMVAVMCVYIRREVWEACGPWPEWESYGFDDDLFCARVRAKGWKIGVFDGCQVDHSLPSVWRDLSGKDVVSELAISKREMEARR